jgi:hypothetical protein
VENGALECEPGSTGCPANASCTSTETGYRCVCADGYESEGDACLPKLCDGDGYDHDGDPYTECVLKTVCEAGTFAQDDGSSRLDRVCVECAQGTFTTAANQPACEPHRTCEPGSRISLRGTTYYDVECELCPMNQFTDVPNERDCFPCDPWHVAEAGSTACSEPLTCAWGDPPPANAESCIDTEYRQFGTVVGDYAADVAATPAGNVVVVGQTSGELVTGEEVGTFDAFVRLYSPSGDVLWTRQFGSEYQAVASSVAVGADGRIIVAGTALGALTGVAVGLEDVFVRAFDADGVVLWTRQWGSAWVESAPDVAVGPSGEIAVGAATEGYVDGSQAGSTVWDAFVTLLDADGTSVWTRQFGTTDTDGVSGVAIDADGSVITGGTTRGVLGAALAGDVDSVLRKYSATGEELWTAQFGTDGVDSINALTLAANGSIVVVGSTSGVLGEAALGATDAFVARFDPDGERVWLRQFGSDALDHSTDVDVDSEGNVVLSGFTAGALASTSAGDDDGWVAAYDDTGNSLWAVQFGTAARDVAFGVAAGPAGRVYAAGETNGSFVEALPGVERDAFVVPITP